VIRRRALDFAAITPRVDGASASDSFPAVAVWLARKWPQAKQHR